MISITEYSRLLAVAIELGFGILIKTTLLISLTAIVVIFLRNSSASTRNTIWASALGLLIFLPIFSIVIPHWEFSLIKPAQVVQNSIETDTGSIPPGINETSVIEENGAEGSPGLVFPEPPVKIQAHYVAIALLGIWVLGALFLLSRIAVHAVRARNIRLRATPIDDDVTAIIIKVIQKRLGIQFEIPVLMSERTNVPFTLGIYNHVVVLPASYENWPIERKRSVLYHEFAHIQRRDYIIHLMVEVVRALYWINPVVWYAAHRYEIERERACDDAALYCGTSSEVYANELLQLVRSQVNLENSIGVIAMSVKTDLAERIRCIMNRKINRSPNRPAGTVLTWILAFAITIPLAAMSTLGAGFFASTMASGDVPDTRDMIVQLEDHEDPDKRRLAAWWLGEHEDTRAVNPLIRSALKDKSVDVRLVSAWALGEIKDDRSIDPLVELLNDKSKLVREMAILSIGEIENPKTVDDLVKACKREPEMSEAVIWALGEIGSEKANLKRDRIFESIGKTPRDNDQVWTGQIMHRKVRDEFKQKGGFDYSSKIDGIIKDLGKGNAKERAWAAFNIGILGIMDHIEDTDPVIPLLDALKDSDPEVRAIAIWALDEINPSRSHHFGNDHHHHIHHDENHSSGSSGGKSSGSSGIGSTGSSGSRKVYK